jgi:tetratricopeptide (TPR) repeat protein
LAIDPENSDALVTLAVMTSRVTTTEQYNANEPNLQRQMRAAAITRRALASNPNNTEAMAILAEQYRRYQWRWSDARALFEKAVQVSRNHMYLRQYYSFFLLTTGDCVASLEQAQVAVRLAPNLTGPKVIASRPLRCLGRYKESQDILMSVLGEQPSNLQVLSEAYLSLLIIRDAAEMRRMADTVEALARKGSPSPEFAALIARTRLAADMLEGRRKDEFLALVRAETDKMMAADAPPLVNNRQTADVLWTLAVELAWAGDAERAAQALDASISSGSLYVTETLPYGSSEFPAEVRAIPQYRRAWTEDQRLVELTRLRKENLDKRRMAGRLPDGTEVTPKY